MGIYFIDVPTDGIFIYNQPSNQATSIHPMRRGGDNDDDDE